MTPTVVQSWTSPAGVPSVFAGREEVRIPRIVSKLKFFRQSKRNIMTSAAFLTFLAVVANSSAKSVR